VRTSYNLVIAGLLLAQTLPVLAHPGAHPARPVQPPAPSAHVPNLDAPATATAFFAALAKGDVPTVLSYLAEEVVIYESGGQESSRDEYAAHHLPLDVAFLANMKTQVLDRKHGGEGKVAWVITRSRFTGTYKNKAVDLYSTESLVLHHGPAGWKIVHVHWSSQPVESKTP
jgi:ketosteroid isomerase-like protein